MYINFWYPAEWSKDLQDEPVKVRMLGQDFVLFRDSQGNAHCLSNTCIHRGASLAGGRVIEIVCSARIMAGSSTQTAPVAKCRHSGRTQKFRNGHGSTRIRPKNATALCLHFLAICPLQTDRRLWIYRSLVSRAGTHS